MATSYILLQLNVTESTADKLSKSITWHDLTTVSGMMMYQQECIQKTINNIDKENIDQIAGVIIKASRIYIYGKSATSSLALLLNFRFKRFGLPVEILPSGGSEISESSI